VKRSIPILCLLAACQRVEPAGPAPLSLEPGPALVAVQVGDAEEAGLLIQALGGSAPALGGAGRLYFDAALAERLRTLGFPPETVDARQVRTAVVRAYGGEAQVRAAGVRLLRRERGYLLVEGTLARLDALRASGVALTGPGRHEPTPLEVRVTMPGAADVHQVNALQVDIYQSAPAGDRWVLTGGAYEWQIEALTAAGYTVERISTVPAPTE
jgi:hypothetical protein